MMNRKKLFQIYPLDINRSRMFSNASLAVAASKQKNNVTRSPVCDWMILKRQKDCLFQLVYELKG